MYTFDSRIRFCECGRDQRLTITSLLDYYQDTCTLQGIDIGLSWDELQKQGLWWVVNFWQIEVNRYPRIGEEVTVGTQASAFKAFFGDRNFNLVTKDGELLSVANSVWTLLDTKDNRPVKVPPEMIERYGVHERLPMQYAARKIVVHAEGEKKPPIVVEEHHLDYNKHVNNAQYVKMAMRFIPENFKITTMLAEYRSQAHLSDVIIPVVSTVQEDGKTSIYVSLNSAQGNAYCVVCFKGTE